MAAGSTRPIAHELQTQSLCVVAIHKLDIRALGRALGRKATNAAAYRAGERIRDERSGKVFDHTKRTDVLHAEIVLPSALAGREIAWARDRATLWNAAELAEKQKNSRVAREFMVALPHELGSSQRLELTRNFSRQIADRYNVAVDTTIHAPREGGDKRNFHAHLLATTREATESGLGRKAPLELSETNRFLRGMPKSSHEFTAVRKLWADLTNEALLQAGIEARVDHRSLRAQGIDREPYPRIPIYAIHAERRGEFSEIAHRIRERHRERVQERTAVSQIGRDPVDIARESAQAWLKYRARQKAGLELGLERSKEKSMDGPARKVHDYDFSL